MPRRLATCASEKVWPARWCTCSNCGRSPVRNFSKSRSSARSRIAEAAVAGVVDERGVVGNVQPAAIERAQAELVLFAVAIREALRVEEADVIEQRTADVETEADTGRNARVAAHRHALDALRE